MQTIVIVLDASQLENPNLDMIYTLPDRVEEVTGGAVQDNGYDYLDRAGQKIGLWLETESEETWWPRIVELLKTEKFEDNDLSRTALVLVSREAGAELDKCRQVWPE